MSRKQKYYSVYQKDNLIAFGTIRELEEIYGYNANTIYCYKYQTRKNGGKGNYKVFEIED